MKRAKKPDYFLEQSHGGKYLENGDAPFRSLLESAAEGIIIVNRSGRIVLANARAKKLFGYDRDEMLGRSVELLVPGRLRELHVEHRMKYLANPCIRPMGGGLDLSGRRGDGSEFPVEISLCHVGGDEEMLVMASVTDISARREMETALRESEQRCHSLIDAVLDSSAGGIIIRNSEFGIVCVNKALEVFFDIRRSELLGKDMRMVVRDKLKDAIEAPDVLLNRISFPEEGDKSGECVDIHIPAGGNRRERWLEFRSEPICSGIYGGGRIDHYFDVTELKLAQEAKAHLMEERIRELETTLRYLEQIARPPKAAVTARLMGAEPLRESAPEVFDDLVESYDGIMDRALERRIYRIEDNLSDCLADIAERLCFLKAAPRDVVDLHSAALKKKSRSVPPSRMRGYLDEGHFLLVEMMGHLATSYRNQAFHGQGAEGQAGYKIPGKGEEDGR
jgi:PAS domain S-box-containing protein